MIGRRGFLAAAAGGLIAGRRALAAPASMRLMAVGQSLIVRDLASQRNPGYEAIRGKLSQADVRFSNLEVAIRGASAQNARADPTGVIADPIVLDSLKQLSFNLLSLSNNHADDLGEAGLLSTIEEAHRRGFTVAGTGRNLAEAARPGELSTPNGSVALVAMASSALAPASIASGTRPGVNHLAQARDLVDPADAERILQAITSAASRHGWVVVYHHDHYWAPNWQDTPEWKKAWCRRCIDAGAAAYISHGVPLLHGIEIYKGRPIFYGLGNFIFHLSAHLNGNVPRQYQPPECWQSAIADCEFEGGALRSLRLDPITLMGGDASTTLHGNPRFADGREAASILERLRAMSKAVGTHIEIAGTTARVRLSPSI